METTKQKEALADIWYWLTIGGASIESPLACDLVREYMYYLQLGLRPRIAAMAARCAVQEDDIDIGHETNAWGVMDIYDRLLVVSGVLRWSGQWPDGAQAQPPVPLGRTAEIWLIGGIDWRITERGSSGDTHVLVYGRAPNARLATLSAKAWAYECLREWQ